jgi:hypothetical protein
MLTTKSGWLFVLCDFNPLLQNANILQSVLLLIRELDKDSLEIVHDTIGKRLQDM